MRLRPFLILIIAILGLLFAPTIHARSSGQLLGPTGLSGQFQKNSIKVSQVDQGSPAHDKVKPGDVIVGIDGKKFSGDIRRHWAGAIDAAETEAAGGKLELLLKDDKTVELQLEVLGTYGKIAPYNCPKTALIVERAAAYLADQINESLKERGKFNSGATHTALLGLMATGERKYLNLVGQAIQQSGILKPDERKIKQLLAGETDMGYVGWYWGYNCILLGEYFLLTGDRSALSALETYALGLARGQDAGGLWGHRMAVDGRLPGYAQMNQSSLSSFLGLLVARKCGINDPDLETAIAKTYAYYASYIGKGGFNYGVHDPDDRRFNNNGMSGLAAMCMNLSENKEGTRFFSGLSATAYDRLEQGHASSFFNPLWTTLGAGLSGPEITHRFFMNSLWFHNSARSWDGSFHWKGKEAGKEGSQTGVALLAYCLPRKALLITGKEQDPSIWLKGAAATGVIEMSQIDYESEPVEDLLGMFDFPFPQARLRAVKALGNRTGDFLPRILQMLETGSQLQRLSALEYFGPGVRADLAMGHMDKIGAILRDTTESPELRAQAAATLAGQQEAAYAYYDDMLRLIIEDQPNDPFRDIDLSVGRSLNRLCPNPYAAGLVQDKRLFYGAANKLIEHKRQHARMEAIKMLAEIPLEDFPIMAKQIIKIIEDTDRSYHSYHSWHSTIGPAIEILANLNIEEGIEYAVGIPYREGGKWGFKVRMLCASLPKYGANAQDALAKLKADERFQKVAEGRFRGMWQKMVKAIEEDPSPANLVALEEALKYAGD